MPTFINRYIRIIRQESDALINDKFEKLNPIQSQIIHSIVKHTEELWLVTSALSETNTDITNRHELLNLITPISGYVDMLSDGWMGELSEHQRDRTKLISVAVHRLIEYVRSYPVKPKKSLASS